MPKCSRCSIEGPLPVTLFFPAPDLLGPLNPTAQARCCSLQCVRDAADALDQGELPRLTPPPATVRTVERDASGQIVRIIDTAA